MVSDAEVKTWSKSKKWNWNHHLVDGGLGRLAACLIDSISERLLVLTRMGWFELPLVLFQQVLKNIQQVIPNAWLTDQTGSFVQAVATKCHSHFTWLLPLYRCPWIYKIDTKNRLRLFDLDSVDSSIIEDDCFDKTDIAHNLTLFLYPDDSNRQNCSISSNNPLWYQMVLNWSSTKPSKKKQPALTRWLLLYKSMILTHQWSSWIDPSLTERGIGMD